MRRGVAATRFGYRAGFGVTDRETAAAGDFAFDTPQEKITRPVIDFATFLSEDVAGRRKPAVGSRRPPAVVVKMVTEAPRGARGSRRRRV